MPDVNEVPIVGQEYQNNGRVKAIDEVVKDKGSSVHTRKVITMENGVMYFLDHFKEKPSTPKTDNRKSLNSAEIYTITNEKLSNKLLR